MRIPSAKIFGGSLLSLLMTASLSAGAGEIEVRSRGIPDHCEWVYRVESDLAFQYSNASLPEGAKPRLVYSYLDQYQDSAPTPEASADFVRAGAGTWKLEFTVVSFSVNPRVFYRRMRFRIEALAEDGSALPSPEPTAYEVMFGRTLEERCFHDGRISTPFQDRTVVPVPF